MSSASAWVVFHHRDFRHFLAARFLAAFGMLMMSVAVGWQVYDHTHDTMALGMVGLAQFLPALLLALPGGLAADRYDRRRVLLFGFGLELLVAVLMLTFTLIGMPHLWFVYMVLALIGVGRSFLAPATQSLLPFLVPQKDFVRAVAWTSTTFQVATISGPIAGGLLYLLGPAYVYATTAACLLGAAILVVGIKAKLKVNNPGAVGFDGIFNGVKYVFSMPIIMGAVSLDLFAVLFGGATALLPVYAADILHIDSWGLGILRSAPGVGAALMAVWLAHHPIKNKAGLKLFTCVALFGVATIVFGLSTNFWLSLGALFVLGCTDMVSVVVRQTLVQIATPDEMRGRVSAVNMLFIGASNELGEFESGVTAAWFGAVRAVVIGGLGTLAVVGVWCWKFPDLRRMDSLEGGARKS